ncbi:hypothetical protein [Gemmata sp.]|uniref:hypothetical protein n=1 Tax=Gemmata sp. TaxID=1914242 RepID=UPI003F6E8592
MSADLKAWLCVAVVPVWFGVALALQLWYWAVVWAWQRRNPNIVEVEPDLHPTPMPAIGRFAFFMCWPLFGVLLVSYRIWYGQWPA